MTQAERIAVGTIGIGVTVLGLKLAAWQVTGSAALFSDAAETVVNVVASFVALFALRLSARPADSNHPYGHTKIEFIAAVIEGVLIVVAAVEILRHAWTAFLHPQPLDPPLLGMALNGVATLINGAWAGVLFRIGRRLRSPALVGDGRHLASDVVTSFGVLAGVTLVVLTGIHVLDPLLAAATACYILYAGSRLIFESVGGLMDVAPPAEEVERMRGIVSRYAAGALEAHDVRMRFAGPAAFVEFHLVVPGHMTVAEAHAICDRIEDALKAERPGLSVTIHVEPEGKAKQVGVLVL